MKYNGGAGNGMYVGPGSGDAMITGIDLDDDGSVDHFRTCNGTGGQCPIQYANNYLQFNITNNANPIIFYVQMVNDGGSVVDLSEDAPPPYPVGSKKGFNFTHLAITNNGTTYGYMTSWRTYGAFSNIIDSGGYLAAVDPDVYMEFSRETYALNEDLNDDGITDHMNFNSTHAFFWVGQERIPIAFGTSILGAGPITLDLDNIPIRNSTGSIYGYITIQSDSAGGNIIPSNATIKVVPYKKGEGYFTVIYEQEGTNHIAGNLQRGDVIKICYESPGQITEDEQVRLNFIPKIGVPTLTKFVTPDVISTERIYMYP